jgi:hypothetical protein
MNYWVEVSSGNWAWENKVITNQNGYKRGLKAPAQTRYLNFLKDINEGDIILSYLTTSMTLKKEWRSAIMGISIANSKMYIRNHSVFVDTIYDKEIPIPIPYIVFKNFQDFSIQFKKLIGKNMQRYLAEITKDDMQMLFKIYPENWIFLKEYCKRYHLEDVL